MKLQALIFSLLSLASLSILAESSQADNKEYPTPKECENDYSGLIATAATGAAIAAAAPFALPFLGFTSAGIAAGSWAASMMSAAAAANGGAVAAGSAVATLQSVATAGVGVAGKVGLASFGSAVGAGIKMAQEKAKEAFGKKEDN
ncbi:interferon alpha-inducible protein 27-like protein 2A [Penaeus chinensis]|uniref:interferon alpha-inducible protein 27-like protein 2A n=1 Tax=Penaeus chinensis TaxID=139456 RepID=UPI001FB5B4FA|nr:interferon alpha-inducible protein 27-like protein 2A [Penaeus chinensis]